MLIHAPLPLYPHSPKRLTAPPSPLPAPLPTPYAMRHAACEWKALGRRRSSRRRRGEVEDAYSFIEDRSVTPYTRTPASIPTRMARGWEAPSGSWGSRKRG